MAGDEESAAYYDSAYGNYAEQLSAQIRAEAFGEDIGQNSWLTADEHRGYFQWLRLDASCEVLEVASGSGGPALFMAAETGCRVTGVDLHEAGVAVANDSARQRGLQDRARFLQMDARERLPFEDEAFDVIVCIDSINHIYDRELAFAEWHRVLRPGGRVLVTDPITVAGRLRREEMSIRSGGMGDFVFTPAGVDEALLREAGFGDVQTRDVTEAMAATAGAWAAVRARHAADLDRIEGEQTNADLQQFLGIVHLLAAERRLLRLAHLAHRA